MQEIELEREGIPPLRHPAPPSCHPEFISGSQARITKRFRLGADFGKCAVRGTSPARISEENDVFPNSQKSKRGRNDENGGINDAHLPCHPVQHKAYKLTRLTKFVGSFCIVSGSQKCAFTLAEVLITLGIIGVVAAMTLPTVINNIQKREIETRFKKFYSEFNQAIKMGEAKNGPIEYWSDYESMQNIVIKELRGKYCNPGTSCPEISDYLNNIYKKNTVSDTYRYNHSAFITNDGFIIWGRSKTVGLNHKMEVFYVDMNGVKKPNEENKDIFHFALVFSIPDLEVIQYPYIYKITNKKGGLYPSGYGYDNYKCSKGNRVFCTRDVVENGFTFPKKYPYW